MEKRNPTLLQLSICLCRSAVFLLIEKLVNGMRKAGAALAVSLDLSLNSAAISHLPAPYVIHSTLAQGGVRVPSPQSPAPGQGEREVCVINGKGTEPEQEQDPG
ncbi:hypothetical protein Baya_15395 [Bagarius yarrelli]|uniref:Uncharacterized protein n=1 Tax=Bagarius yarrelli TaxID=175774 RepID=A0A556VBD9_BAGYA|nr:hypothetical protein Baya_15395 [Bagarius yarrelli]